MEYNSSLSARIKRRNKQGFRGIGTGLGFIRPLKPYGDYNDPSQNHKTIDYNIAEKRKARVGMKRKVDYRSIPYTVNAKALNKKYADGHQKLKK